MDFQQYMLKNQLNHHYFFYYQVFNFKQLIIIFDAFLDFQFLTI